MQCKKCKMEMIQRKAGRAAYEAPEIYFCTKCGAMYIKDRDEIKRLGESSYFLRKNV